MSYRKIDIKELAKKNINKLLLCGAIASSASTMHFAINQPFSDRTPEEKRADPGQMSDNALGATASFGVAMACIAALGRKKDENDKRAFFQRLKDNIQSR